MCRFSVQNAVPAEPDSPGLEQLLENDAFDWFECLDDLPEEQLASLELPAAVARNSDSTGGSEASMPVPEMGGASTTAQCASGSSDGSSYDLMELFKQQIDQDPAVLLASAVQAQYGFAAQPPAAAVPSEACVPAPAMPACAAPVLKMQAYSGMSATAAAGCMPPAQAPALPSPSFSCMSSGMNTAAGMPVASSGAASAPVRKPGCKRTQAEVEAAVERIKQKRRESAQRSRARKNEYVRQLEYENQGLKDEVQRLQQLLAQMQHSAAACLPCHPQQQLSPIAMM